MTEGHRGSFWTTLPGLLTGSAALITAITGAALVTRGDGSPSGPHSIAGNPPGSPAKMEAVPTNGGTAEASAADPIAEMIKAEADKLNASAPLRINALMTLTRASASGRVATMDYVLSQRTLDDEQIRDSIYTNACNDPDSQKMLGSDATLRMRFSFPGEPAPLTVDVTAADCAGRV